MNRYSAGAILGLLIYAWAPTLAEAVTVNVDIRTEGEPVPGTTITFQTNEGEDIPPVEFTELTEEPGSSPEAESSTPASSSEEPQSAMSEDAGTPDAASGHGFKVELPETVIGKDVVVVVRKDDALIKRETVTLEESSDIAIEAYDPADAELAIDLSQPKTCKGGDRCDYEIAVANDGNGIYVGPVFLAGQLHGTVAEPDSETQWWCRYAGGGRQFCLIRASLEPGASKSWTLSAQLPKRVSKGAKNCLEIQTLKEGPSGRTDPVVQAVQAGLAAKGIDAGRPDGIAGPTTKAAMAKFINQEELEPSADQQAVFEALFGLLPKRLARLEVSKGDDCETLGLIPQPRTVTKGSKDKSTASKKSVSTPKSSHSKRTTSDARLEQRRRRALDAAIGIGIGIGTGLATQGSRKKSGGHHRIRERRPTLSE